MARNKKAKRPLGIWLSIRVFLMTTILLSAIGAITMWLMLKATPPTFSYVMTPELVKASNALAKTLSETYYDDSAIPIDIFVTNHAYVRITSLDGEDVLTPSSLQSEAGYNPGIVDIPVKGDPKPYNLDSSLINREGYSIQFSFKGSDIPLLLVVGSRTGKLSNSTYDLIIRTLPQTAAIVLLISAVSSLIYSLWVIRLKNKNYDLKEDYDRQVELDKERTAFFNAASHELKTPITILSGQLTGMIDNVGVYKDRDKYLEKSLEVTGRMESLVNELLTVSRMEKSTEAPTAAFSDTDINRIISEELASDIDLIEEKNMTVNKILADSCVIKSDPRLVGRIISNVITNAIFYSPEGAAITVTTAASGSKVIFTVENSGVHIADEDLGHVFEAFYRADASRNRKTGGSGLGLYIVKVMMERLGGEYQMTNTEGGVRFTGTLPQNFQ